MLQPLKDRVLLYPEADKSLRKYGDIELPDNVKTRSTNTAIVLALGPDAQKYGDLNQGDRVVMSEQNRGTPINYGKKTYYLTPAKFILMVLK